MSIKDGLKQILQTKSEIKEAIIAKGVEVDSSLPFSEYPDKIAEISGGGEGGEKTNFKLAISNAKISVVVE